MSIPDFFNPLKNTFSDINQNFIPDFKINLPKPEIKFPGIGPKVNVPTMPMQEINFPNPIDEIKLPKPGIELPKFDPDVDLHLPEPVSEINFPNPINEIKLPKPGIELPRPNYGIDFPMPEPIEKIAFPKPLDAINLPKPIIDIPKFNFPKVDLPHFKIDQDLDADFRAVGNIVSDVLGLKDFSNVTTPCDFPKKNLLTGHEINKTATPPKFEHQLREFLQTFADDKPENRFNNLIGRLESVPNFPAQVKAKIENINKKLQFYLPEKNPSPEQFDRENHYFTFDKDRFMRENQHFKSSKNDFVPYEDMIYRTGAHLKLAPIHPAVHKYIPKKLAPCRNSELAYTSLIEGVHEKIAWLREINALDQFNHSEEIVKLVDEGAYLPGEHIGELIMALQEQEITGLTEEQQEIDRRFKKKLLAGVATANVASHEESPGPAENFAHIGKAIFGEHLLSRPIFKVKTDVLISDADGNKHSISSLANSYIKLPHFDYENVLARLGYYYLNPTEDSEITSEYYSAKSKIITQPGKELSSGKILFVNGINNSPYNAFNSAQAVSNMANGAEVTCIYNGTQTLYVDILHESKDNLNFKSTEPVRLLTQEILDTFEKKEENYQILINCHSQGAIITRNALMQIPPHLRKRVTVVAINPAAYIDRFLCGDVAHFVSSRDWSVPYIDKAGRERCKDTIYEVPFKKSSALGLNWLCDHSFLSKTFEERLREVNEEFVHGNK